MMDPDMRQALLDVIEHMDTLTTKMVGVEREIVALRKHMNHEIAVLMDETASKEDLQDLKEHIDHELESLRADMVEKRLSLAGPP